MREAIAFGILAVVGVAIIAVNIWAKRQPPPNPDDWWENDPW